MQGYLWNRILVGKVIKDVIHRGRGNAARKRSQELAAVGIAVKNGRPRRIRESFESSVLASGSGYKRNLPKALGEGVIRECLQVQVSCSTPVVASDAQAHGTTACG